jgi:hypothetical protein
MTTATRRGWPALSLAAAVAATGCGVILGLGDDYSSSASGADASDSTTSSEAAADGATISPECAAYAAASCSYVSKCTPGNLRRDYDTEENCLSVTGARCAFDANAVPSVLTPSWFNACSASLTTSANACASGPVPMNIPTPNDPCAVVGPISGGKACGLNDQCETDVCYRTGGGLCGTCLPGVGLGQPCNPLATVCTRGLVCGSKSSCVTLVGVNAHCDLGATSACVAGTDCVIGDAGATSGTCLTEGTLGNPCDPGGVGAPKCNIPWGYYCDATRHCAAITYVETSQPCAALGTVCTNGAACVKGTCQPSIPVGDACTLAGNPGCVAPAQCVTTGMGAQGTCTMPDPSCAAHD